MDPLAPVAMVSITDPGAAFASKEAREEYRRTRNPALWKHSADRKAAVFMVSPLSAEAAVKLAGFDPVTAPVLAFRLCVLSIMLPNGDVMTAAQEHHYLFGCAIAPESWVAEVAAKVGPRRVSEIGEAALRLAMLEDADPLLQPPGQSPPS